MFVIPSHMDRVESIARAYSSWLLEELNTLQEPHGTVRDIVRVVIAQLEERLTASDEFRG